MRDMVWSAVRSKVPEGMILPWWVLEAMRRAYSLGKTAGAHRAREEIRNTLGVNV